VISSIEWQWLTSWKQCPALNAAANHNYIPHNGIVDKNAIINGMNEAFNFDLGPAAFIFAVDLIFDGDPLSGRFSIGFHSPLTQSIPILGNLLGNESGKSTPAKFAVLCLLFRSLLKLSLLLQVFALTVSSQFPRSPSPARLRSHENFSQNIPSYS
jgi:Peroxidase, family 2